MKRIAVAIVLVFGPSLFAQPAAAQKSPEKIKLTAASKQGAVLIRVPVQPFSYALQFSKNGNSGFLSRVYLMKVDEADAPGFRYIARTLAPGRYRLDQMWQQGQWSACLEQGTFEFDVKPGEIAYLGTLHTDRVLAAIQSQAVAANEIVQSGTAYFQSHGRTSPPIIDGRDESGLHDAKAFARERMNRSDGAVRLANVTDTTFATSGLGKAIKVCG
jgi:hypothetical protein